MKKRGMIGMLLLGLVLIGVTACGSEEVATEPSTGTEDSDTIVTGDGNIEASSHARLTFGSGGRIERILVEEGDTVRKGDVLARLETSALELSLSQAKVDRIRAELAEDQAQKDVAQARAGLTRAQAGITQAEAGVTQAQAALLNAEITLELDRDTYTVSDIRVAEAGVDVARRNLDNTLLNLAQHTPGTSAYDEYQKVVLQAEAGLKAAQATLDSMLAGYDVKEVAVKVLLFEAAGQAVELADQNLAIAGENLDLAEQALEIAEQSLNLAGQSLELADQTVELVQKQLKEAAITAPFDGTVYLVGARAGEFLSPAAYSGTTIVGIVNLGHMELTVKVEELDIARVKTGQNVMISLDALPETTFEGTVSFISPVASGPDGVVLFEDEDVPEKYEVKIDFSVPAGAPVRAGMSATVEIAVE